jgi:chorismate synthase
MSSNTFGETFKITTFGESHGAAIGVVIDGVRPGLQFNVKEIEREMERRRPARTPYASWRKEMDRVAVLSGVFEGKTTGAPICLMIYNRDVDSSPYEDIKDLFRPSTGDYTWHKKYGIRDWRGGGRLSGRETAARVAAGAFAKSQLRYLGIEIFGFVRELGGVGIKKVARERIEDDPLFCPDPAASRKMQKKLEAAMAAGDSLGGVVEVQAVGVPAGLGDPVFRKLDAMLAQGLMSIGGVKGVEIGDGFALAGMKGSKANDQMNEKGFVTNRSGGIQGGISNGETIVARLAVKPTPSIRKTQRTVDTSGRKRIIAIRGRHDPCIAPRVVPVAEAMTAIVLLDALLRQLAVSNAEQDVESLRFLIDGCDDLIVESLARRMALARRIGELKKEKKLAVRDAGREKEVLARTAGVAEELELPRKDVARLFKEIMAMSKAAQKTVK